VLAGMGSGLDYIIDTNFKGTLHTLELAVQCKSKLIFLSTSRVYPISYLENLDHYETETRFELADSQPIAGVSKHGIKENFPLDKARSVYGTTKLASEMMIQEYESFFGLEYVINRCGVVAGPHQMGKVDQGVVTLWVARHFWGKDINYIGFGGTGKQVRDVMHVYDLFDLVDFEMHHFEQVKGQVFNAGGGYNCSTSLFELSELCEKVTGNKVVAHAIPETRQADIPWYITNNTKITEATGWKPKRNMLNIVQDTCKWIAANEQDLKKILL
jgi:CDP-paratose 2-epimerase